MKPSKRCPASQAVVSAEGMRSWGEVGTRMVFMAAASPCYVATRIGPFAAPLTWTQAPRTASLFARQGEARGRRHRARGLLFESSPRSTLLLSMIFSETYDHFSGSCFGLTSNREFPFFALRDGVDRARPRR